MLRFIRFRLKTIPMNPRKIDLNLLYVFNALMETNAVGKAAELLNISQPAMSHSLAKLREALDDEVLVRIGNRMEPTPKALELQPLVENAIAASHSVFVPKDNFDPSQAEQEFIISTTDDVQLRLAPLLVKHLESVAPNMRVSFCPLESDYSYRELANGIVDLTVTLDWSAPDGLISTRVYEDDFVCIVRKGHPILEQGFNLKHFVQYKHGLIAPLGGKLGRVDQHLREQGIHRDIRTRLPHFLMAPHLVAQTDLIVTLPSAVAKHYEGLLPITLLEPPFKLEPLVFKAFWHKSLDNQPAHRWLRNTIKELLHT